MCNPLQSFMLQCAHTHPHCYTSLPHIDAPRYLPSVDTSNTTAFSYRDYRTIESKVFLSSPILGRIQQEEKENRNVVGKRQLEEGGISQLARMSISISAGVPSITLSGLMYNARCTHNHKPGYSPRYYYMQVETLETPLEAIVDSRSCRSITDRPGARLIIRAPKLFAEILLTCLSKLLSRVYAEECGYRGRQSSIIGVVILRRVRKSHLYLLIHPSLLSPL